MNIWIREVELKTKNKKRASNDVTSLPAPQSLKNYDGVAILSIATPLGFVESFFMRRRSDTEPRASQFS